jgi:ATP-binding cassette subfamily F protein uup
MRLKNQGNWLLKRRALAIIKDFSVRILRGDRIGLIGPNGSGKSTLLNILLAKLAPEQGKVVLGTQLKIVYFDQLRKTLDLEKSVIDNVVQGSDSLEINGQRKHIMSYLGDFLFTPQRARTPVKALSGGECNRLLLAQLFAQPANLLVMDEPTNDLDIETLELLEELLSNYTGTLLLVSHDRAFLDNVVTSTLVFEGQGRIQEFVGGYQDWLRQAKPALKAEPATAPTAAKPKPAAKKLSYKEQKELAALPQQIEKLEMAKKALEKQCATAEFYQQEAATIAEALEKLKKLTSDLELAYQRWEALEKKW